jgi:hypothetical protein
MKTIEINLETSRINSRELSNAIEAIEGVRRARVVEPINWSRDDGHETEPRRLIVIVESEDLASSLQAIIAGKILAHSPQKTDAEEQEAREQDIKRENRRQLKDVLRELLKDNELLSELSQALEARRR